MSRGNEPVYPTGTPPYGGMTLREHYAGLAMQGLLAGDPEQRLSEEQIADLAWRQADKMLAAQEPPK